MSMLTIKLKEKASPLSTVVWKERRPVKGPSVVDENVSDFYGI